MPFSSAGRSKLTVRRGCAARSVASAAAHVGYHFEHALPDLGRVGRGADHPEKCVLRILGHHIILGRLVLFDVRNLGVVPVLRDVAFADGEINVLRKIAGIALEHVGLEVAVATEELRGSAVVYADLPDLPAAPDRHPFERPEVQLFAAVDRHFRFCVFAQHAVSDRVQRVFAGADVIDPELAFGVANIRKTSRRQQSHLTLPANALARRLR